MSRKKPKARIPSTKKQLKSRMTLFYVLVLILIIPLLVFTIIKLERGSQDVLPAATTHDVPAIK